MGVPIMNKFITPMGTVYLDYDPYCHISCHDFEPRVLKTLKTDDDGKVVLDEHGEVIVTGVKIFCGHQCLCKHVARSLADRLKGETKND